MFPTSSPHHGAAVPATLAVLGAGAWGTVIAALLGENGHHVRLWCRRSEVAHAIGTTRRNDAYVPGLTLPANVQPTADIAEATLGAAAVVVAVPSRSLRETVERLSDVDVLLSVTKGFEGSGLARMSEVMQAVHPDASVGALSGPNLASEIALGLPAAATLACADDELARRAQGWLSRPTFRVYASRDVAGVEACGALKNVIALAAGMSDGLGLGANAHAALLTRGMSELVRVGTALGGETRTFYGLAGIGDLIATCGSTRSRNHQVGVRIARGERVEDVLASGITAEGLATVRHVAAYADDTGLDLPICREVFRVVYERKAPGEAIRDLMARAQRVE
ncbi:NAD(P)H-dependent glycerol-3-phosphate dehydrogenase [soil metagenome]|nr:NAD(P)-dependent glycerol-3-phosphate dehydrogenase [Trueperaceae bacterium]